MFPMQVPAHPLSPRSAFLALLLAATPLIPTSGSVTANAAKLALGEQVSDTLQLGQSGVAIVLPGGDWRVSGLVRPRQIGAPYALAVLTRSEGQALTGTVWIRAVGEARFETSAMWCSDGGVRLHVEPIVGASGRGCWWVRSWTTALAPADLQLYWRQAFSRLRREGGTPAPGADRGRLPPGRRRAHVDGGILVQRKPGHGGRGEGVGTSLAGRRSRSFCRQLASFATPSTLARRQPIGSAAAGSW